MKKKIWIINCLLATFLLNSCDKYLDIVPDNVATLDYAFKDRIRAEQYLFTCYSYMPRHGLPQSPSMFDDYTWSNSGVEWLPQLGFQLLRDGNRVTSPILNYWNGENGATNLWQAIRDCNIFLNKIDEVRDLDEYEKKRWAAEVNFLKAYYHFFLMQMYGPIPVVDENLPIDANPSDVAVYREPIDKVVDYIVQTIDKTIDDLPLKIDLEVSELGRITKPIALSMKAKVLLTAASPLFNGNKDYSTFVDNKGTQLFNQTAEEGKWQKAAQACKAAIDICHEAGIKLYEFNNQSLNISETTRKVLTAGRVVTDKWNQERIWGIGHYGNSRILEEYTLPALHGDHASFVRSVTVPTLKAVEEFYTKNGVPIEEDVNYDYEGRYELVTTGIDHDLLLQQNVQTINLHLNREYRFYGSLAVDAGLWFGLGRLNEKQQWPVNCRFGQQSGRVGIERYSISSYYIKKLANIESVFNVKTYIEKRWDFPILRLADLYLMYAEALNESLQTPNQEVYKYVNAIRERAGIPSVEEAWATHSKFPDKYLSKVGMRDIIRRERNIELMFEGHRLWDARRWKIAVQEFGEPVQGWNIEENEPADFYMVRTINNLRYNLKDVFWPIKQSELSINRNLIQNIGW